MVSFSSCLAIGAIVVGRCLAFPAYAADGPTPVKRDATIVKRDFGCPSPYNGPDLSQYPTLADRLGTYKAPGPDDSRGPCPGLNTLANHGLINHDGKNINSDDVFDAFARGFGICGNAIATALHNWEVVCGYTEGKSCGIQPFNGTFLLTNLTQLGLPHSFEHDHSYSRQDYKENYGSGHATDNIFFNATEFQTSLDVVDYSLYEPFQPQTADFYDFNQIRLKRESIQNTDDFPGWFVQALPTMMFETGFIFGATFDRDSNGNQIGDEPVARLDWWSYWFREESFPTQLGWVPASSEYFEINFVSSASKAVLAASYTTTPNNLPAGATATTAAAGENLPEGDPTTTFELFGEGTATPYVAPTPPSDIQKRDAASATTGSAPTTGPAASSSHSSVLSSVASVAKASPSLVSSAKSIVGPAPTPFDFYQQSLDITSLKAQILAAETYQSKVVSAITSLIANS